MIKIENQFKTFDITIERTKNNDLIKIKVRN